MNLHKKLWNSQYVQKFVLIESMCAHMWMQKMQRDAQLCTATGFTPSCQWTTAVGKTMEDGLLFEIAACLTGILVISEPYDFSLKRGHGCLLLPWSQLGSAALPLKVHLP